MFGSHSKGGPAKILYTKSKIRTLSCRMPWAWSERVKLYSRQMILPRKTKTYATLLGPALPSGSQGPGNLYHLLPHLPNTCGMWHCVKCYLYTGLDRPLRFHEVAAPNDCIGNQTRDLQSRSAVPQPPAPPTLLPWRRQKVFPELRQISTRLHRVTSRRIAQSSCTPQRQSEFSGTK